MNVTYAITVCNELTEVTNLINFLLPAIHPNDDILIQYDSLGVSEPVLQYLKILDNLHSNVTVISQPLNGDFASFKNNLKLHANGLYIMQIDADEIPHEFLVKNMHNVLYANNGVDLFFVPRINTVDGITDEHIRTWRWKVNENGWINFPDLQTRLYKRTTDIEWVGKVHERIKGYNTMSVFPFSEEYCLYHHKTIDRQERQNKLYDTIS